MPASSEQYAPIRIMSSGIISLLKKHLAIICARVLTSSLLPQGPSELCHTLFLRDTIAKVWLSNLNIVIIIVFILSCTSTCICKSQLRLCQLWCFVIQLNEDSDSEKERRLIASHDSGLSVVGKSQLQNLMKLC